MILFGWNKRWNAIHENFYIQNQISFCTSFTLTFVSVDVSIFIYSIFEMAVFEIQNDWLANSTRADETSKMERWQDLDIVSSRCLLISSDIKDVGDENDHKLWAVINTSKLSPKHFVSNIDVTDKFNFTFISIIIIGNNQFWRWWIFVDPVFESISEQWSGQFN